MTLLLVVKKLRQLHLLLLKHLQLSGVLTVIAHWRPRRALETIGSFHVGIHHQELTATIDSLGKRLLKVIVLLHGHRAHGKLAHLLHTTVVAWGLGGALALRYLLGNVLQCRSVTGSMLDVPHRRHAIRFLLGLGTERGLALPSLDEWRGLVALSVLLVCEQFISIDIMKVKILV